MWQLLGKDRLKRMSGEFESKTAYCDCKIMPSRSPFIDLPRRPLLQNRARKPVGTCDRNPPGMEPESRVNDPEPSGGRERQAYPLRFRAAETYLSWSKAGTRATPQAPRAKAGVAIGGRLTENAAPARFAEGSGTMPATISKHIRIDKELWQRLETAAGERETTANRLLAELAERWLETREWPQSDVQVRVARSSLFTAQAIALDMIAAGRKKEVDDILEHVATIVPDIAPEPPAQPTTASDEGDSRLGSS